MEEQSETDVVTMRSYDYLTSDDFPEDVVSVQPTDATIDKYKFVEVGFTAQARAQIITEHSWPTINIPSDPQGQLVWRTFVSGQESVVIDKDLNILTLKEAREHEPEVRQAILDELEMDQPRRVQASPQARA